MRKRAKETATILKMAARADAIMSASTATLPIHVQPFRARLRQRRRPALQRLQRRAQRRHPRRLFSRLDAVRLLGIALTVVLRILAGVSGLHRHGGPPLLYPLLALLCGAVIWILLFRGLT